MTLLALLSAFSLYYANLHSHTGYSDGVGTPARAFAYARDTAKIHVLAVTDHAEGLTATEWASCGRAADSATIPGKFVGLRGFEWTSGGYRKFTDATGRWTYRPQPEFGHANVLNSADYLSAYSNDSLPDSLYAWLCRQPGAIGQFNHSSGSNFLSYWYSPAGDVGMGLMEGQGTSYMAYHYALDKGWRVGATCGSDNHDATWGKSSYRTGIWASCLTRDTILAALRAMRTFGTHDRDMSLRFVCQTASAEVWQGGTVRPGPLRFKIIVNDPTDDIRVLKLVTRGRVVVDSLRVGGRAAAWEFDLYALAGQYFYAYACGTDGQPAWTSAIWVSR